MSVYRAEAYIERAEGAASREASEIDRGVCEVCALCSESEHYIYVVFLESKARRARVALTNTSVRVQHK